MKNKILAIILFLIGLGVIPTKSQTFLVVETTAGDLSTYNLISLNKITFGESNILVNNMNDTDTYLLSSVKKITFDSEVGIQNPNQYETSITVYPNPAQDLIYISNLNGQKADIIIYSLFGTVVLHNQYNSGEAIDISDLTSGFYLIKINGKTLKFSKL